MPLFHTVSIYFNKAFIEPHHNKRSLISSIPKIDLKSRSSLLSPLFKYVTVCLISYGCYGVRESRQIRVYKSITDVRVWLLASQGNQGNSWYHCYMCCQLVLAQSVRTSSKSSKHCQLNNFCFVSEFRRKPAVQLCPIAQKVYFDNAICPLLPYIMMTRIRNRPPAAAIYMVLLKTAEKLC